MGAKQNRIVNTTILLAPESETTIPVSCVEQGRWAHTSDYFHSEKWMSPSAMRKNKSEHVMASLRTDMGFTSNQGRIWSEIRERQARREAESPTGRMSEIYTKDRPLLDEYLQQFRTLNNQVGALFLINGRIAGLYGFGSPGILARVFPKLVESYAIDALDMYRPAGRSSPTAPTRSCSFTDAGRRKARSVPPWLWAPIVGCPRTTGSARPWSSRTVCCT